MSIVLGGAAVVLVAAVVTLLTDQRSVAFVNGVAPTSGVALLRPPQRVCQRDVAVFEPFGGIGLAAITAGRPGPALDVTVLDHRSRRELGRGRVPAGYRTAVATPTQLAVARLGRVRSRRSIDVCVKDAGSGLVLLTGTREPRPQNVDLVLIARGEPKIGANLALTFLSRRPSSLFTRLPTAFERAALFHPPFMGAWTFWLLAALVAVAVPLLLARGLRSAIPGAHRAAGDR